MIGRPKGMDIWHRGIGAAWWRLMLAAGLALLLAACSSGKEPFGKDDGVPGPKGKPVPPIALVATNGMPQSRVPGFSERLTALGGQRDIAIVEGVFDDGTLSLSGTFNAIPDPAAVRLSYSWLLTDKGGAILHQFAGEEQGASAGGADAWSAITPAVLERVAAKSIRSIADKLSSLGYATQTAAQMPPGDAMMAALPSDNTAIDFETVNGPQASSPEQTASIASLIEDDQAALPEPEPEAEPAKKAKKPGAQKIKAVAVVPVKGASGKGNAELTAAMRKTLKDAGWPVLKAPREDALTIAGAVKLGPAAQGQQNVALAWAVKSPDGKTLGVIKQANNVQAGSLDGAWGEAAGFVAEAAAGGIFDLIRKYR
jgi:hypothetical protein